MIALCIALALIVGGLAAAILLALFLYHQAGGSTR